MVEEVYSIYQKKYKLPSFAEMEDEFELSTIETPDFFLRQVKRKLKERLQGLSEIFAEVLNPSTDSFVQLYECKIFDVKEKDKIYGIFRELQYYLRAINEAEYVNNEKKDAELIIDIHKDWKTIKEKSNSYLKKLKEAWKKEVKLKEALEYFG